MGTLGVNFVALGFVHDVDINLFSFRNLIAYHFEFISLAGSVFFYDHLPDEQLSPARQVGFTQ